MTTQDKAVFIRSEFECFVRIGLDLQLRTQLQRILEHHLMTDGRVLIPPSLYLETHDSAGELREMWYLESDWEQLLRLLEFLRRFNLEDVRLIDSMLRREI